MTGTVTGFVEVAREVYLLRYPVLAVNVTLVVGDREALLVDTLSTDAQARELAEAVRAVTAYPLTLVNTHHHFDHCFGNAVLAAGGRPVWGQEEAAAVLAEQATRLQRRWYAEWAPREPELAAGLASVRVQPPDRTVHRQATIRLGDRLVLLRYFGRGHTAGDLVVQVPDADLLVAGDLVEQDGPPAFEDSYPLAWPETLAALLRLAGPETTVLPGHGTPVDREFVAAQQHDLAALAWLIRDGDADGVPAEALARTVAARARFGPAAALTAVRRGYAEIDGRNG